MRGRSEEKRNFQGRGKTMPEPFELLNKKGLHESIR